MSERHDSGLLTATGRCAWLGLAAICWPAVAGVPARADVITMNDGRVLEGRIVNEQREPILFEIQTGGIRATLELKRADIKSIEKKPLPKDKPEGPAVEQRAAVSKPSPESAGLYLEIPIVGRFGEDVFARGIANALSYAKSRGIRNIVFTVDSTGGTMDQAIAIHRVLSQYANDLTYHAIVRKCLGVALIVPFWCSTIHVTPGSVVGGSNEKMEKVPKKFASQEEQVVRAQLARDLMDEAKKRGRKGEFIRAMVDPEYPLAGWRDANGEVEIGPEPPANLPADRLIFKCEPGTVLVLTYDQAVKLGIPSIDGGAEDLGKALGIAEWRAESSYGQESMDRAADYHRQRIENKQAQFEDAVAQNVRLREVTRTEIENDLKEAAKWDPTKGTYKAFTTYWDWNWGLMVPWDQGIWTPESRAKWRNRNEACGYFMERALRGIDTMIRLERQAKELGLVPTFKPGQLENMRNDVVVKLEMLQRSRYRIGE
jgi:hypothetical protein